MFGSIKLAINSRINYDTEENITLTIVFFQNRSFLTDRRQKKMKVLYPKQWSTCLAGSIVRTPPTTKEEAATLKQQGTAGFSSVSYITTLGSVGQLSHTSFRSLFL